MSGMQLMQIHFNGTRNVQNNSSIRSLNAATRLRQPFLRTIHLQGMQVNASTLQCNVERAT